MSAEGQGCKDFCEGMRWKIIITFTPTPVSVLGGDESETETPILPHFVFAIFYSIGCGRS